MNEHKTKSIKLDGKYTAKIDKKIADIIEFLWKIELETCLSCEDNNGKVWIHFYEDSYKHFMQSAYIEFKNLGGEDTLYDFILDNCEISACYEEFDCFDEDAEPLDNPELTIGLRFPKELLTDFKRLLFKDLSCIS